MERYPPHIRQIIPQKGGIHMKRVFAILAAVAAGLGMVAAIIAAVVNRRDNY